MAEQSVTSQLNNPTFPKNFTPYSQHNKMYQPYIPSSITISSPPILSRSGGQPKYQQTKLTKKSSLQTNNTQQSINETNSLNAKIEQHAQKYVPSFLENRNVMKGSIMTTQQQSKAKFLRVQGHSNSNSLSPSQGHQNLKKPRLPAQNSDMRFSNMQFANQSLKVPSFLQDKNKDKRNIQTKIQKMQSNKQITHNRQIFEQNTLKTSYGAKKAKIQKQQQQKFDPAAAWLKSSMQRKRQKHISINDFELIKQLGAGKYGKVYLVIQKKTNFICALKILEKALIAEQLITDQIIRQLKIQSFLNHKNLIKMYGFFDDPTNIYLIMEAATGGQLFKQLKKHQSMPQAKVASIMRQICNAVNQLHANRIIHRDIKPQNIVLHDNVVKLCDFGWSVVLDTHLRTTFCGTPLYVGPQILKGKQYDQKIDIWSLGVMMYEMLVGENPFRISKQEDLIKIIKDEIKIPTYIQISNEGKEFLFACLQKNPQDRLTIRQLLNHQFFKKFPERDKKI